LAVIFLTVDNPGNAFITLEERAAKDMMSVKFGVGVDVDVSGSEFCFGRFQRIQLE
jgi:hypothetical protein